MSETSGKTNVLLGITGSIAAYKAIDLTRKLIDRGLSVKVIMSKSATEFINPLTFETITGSKVVTSLWEQSDAEGISHIELGAWADVYAIVPATAETIAKIATGQADSELLAALLVTRAPVIVAPAMNTNMYDHPATQENVAKLKERGIEIIAPEDGDLACGWNGTGRLADPAEILYHILRALSVKDLRNKKVIVTAGPTREMIDPVRFISNCSSGRMGIAVATDAFIRGADVELVHGPIDVKVPRAVKCHSVLSALEMQEVVTNLTYEGDVPADIVVMTAAVADARPSKFQGQKIKKASGYDKIELTHNPDILTELGERKGDAVKPVLVGFALETGEEEDLVESIKEKMANKKVDFVVGNLVHDALDLNTNRVWIIDKIGRIQEVMTTYKSRVARKIFDFVLGSAKI